MLLRCSTTVISAGTTDNKAPGSDSALNETHNRACFCHLWCSKHTVVQDCYLNLRCTAQIRSFLLSSKVSAYCNYMQKYLLHEVLS